MKDIYLPCLAGLVLIFLSSQAWAETITPKPDLRVAYSTKVFPDLDARDVTAAMQLYINELAKQVGYHADGQVYDSTESVIKEIRAGNFDFIALSSVAYLRIRDRVDTELALGQVKGGKMTSRYLLVVAAQSPYQKIRDLRNKRINLLKGDDIGPLYLSTVLLKHKLPEMKKFFFSVEEKNKPSQLVLPVFFGQSDACVITDVAFENMVEMNPQLGKGTRVIASSDEMVDTVTVFRKTLKEDTKQKVMKAGTTLKRNPRGQQILTLFRTEDLTPLKEADLEGIRHLVVEHDRLRGRR